MQTLLVIFKCKQFTRLKNMNNLLSSNDRNILLSRINRIKI